MDCPFCSVNGPRGAVHEHMIDAHGDRVLIRIDEAEGERFYKIDCPDCGAPWERQIKPRGKDPNFILEFDRQIKLVAFDMLLHHMNGAHAAS